MRDTNNPADVAKHELIARAQEQLEPFLAAQIAHQRQLFTRDLENRVARHFPSKTPFDEVRFTGEPYEVMEIAAHEAAAEAVANYLPRRERSQSPRSHGRPGRSVFQGDAVARPAKRGRAAIDRIGTSRAPELGAAGSSFQPRNRNGTRPPRLPDLQKGTRGEVP